MQQRPARQNVESRGHPGKSRRQGARHGGSGVNPTEVSERIKMTGDAWDEFRLRLDAINTGTPLDQYGPMFQRASQTNAGNHRACPPGHCCQVQRFLALFANSDWLAAALDSGAVDLGPIKVKIDQQIQSIIGQAKLAAAAFDDIWANMGSGQKLDLAKALGIDATGGTAGVKSAIRRGHQRDDRATTADGGHSGTHHANQNGSGGHSRRSRRCLKWRPRFANIGKSISGFSALGLPVVDLGAAFTALRTKVEEAFGGINTAVANLKLGEFATSIKTKVEEAFGGINDAIRNVNVAEFGGKINTAFDDAVEALHLDTFVATVKTKVGEAFGGLNTFLRRFEVGRCSGWYPDTDSGSVRRAEYEHCGV